MKLQYYLFKIHHHAHVFLYQIITYYIFLIKYSTKEINMMRISSLHIFVVYFANLQKYLFLLTQVTKRWDIVFVWVRGGYKRRRDRVNMMKG